ncbi:MAG: hypothetical protein GX640_13940 [Fibrobacter sp.]|nr:hypothetical protein [Fibrobacter sp.]
MIDRGIYSLVVPVRRAFFGVSLLNGLVLNSFAAWNLSVDGDGRVSWNSSKSLDTELHSLGFSLRKTIADKTGDRFLLSGLFEANHNFKDLMIHELYFKYKGPMGLWNITAGRIGIPYGLLTYFSTSRLLFESSIEQILGFDADNGITVSGVKGMFDYGISLTQGYGAHRMPSFPGEGFGAARIGIVFGDAEEYMAGLSIAGGYTQKDHMADTSIKRFVGGIDATISISRLLIRIEIDGGLVNEHLLFSLFSIIDYALHNRLDLNGGFKFIRQNNHNSTILFSGLTVKPKWVTIRGGYTYEKSQYSEHTIAVQLYRLFSFSF